MQKMPEFIQATYQGKHKDDYALKAKIAMDGLADHPEEEEYIKAYAANFLRLAGKFDESVDYCRQILPSITIWDCRYDTFNTLINALTQAGRLEEVIEVRLQLMEEEDNSNDSDNLEKIALAYKEAGNAKKSIEYFERYLEAVDNACETDTYNDLSRLYEAQGDYDNAAKYLMAAARDMCAESEYLWFNTGRNLLMAGKFDEAKFYFEVSTKLLPDDAQSFYMIGTIYQEKKDSYRALHYYMEALKRQPKFPEVYNNMGSLSFNEDGDIKSAIKNIETAVTMNPDKKLAITLYLNLARLYKKISDYDMHEHYQAKLLGEIGFPVGDLPKEDEDENDDDEDDEGNIAN